MPVTFSYMSAGVLDGRVAVYVAQLAETEAVQVVAGVCEAIDDHAVTLTVEYFAHATVQLVVRYTRPVQRLLQTNNNISCCHSKFDSEDSFYINFVKTRMNKNSQSLFLLFRGSLCKTMSNQTKQK